MLQPEVSSFHLEDRYVELHHGFTILANYGAVDLLEPASVRHFAAHRYLGSIGRGPTAFYAGEYTRDKHVAEA